MIRNPFLLLAVFGSATAAFANVTFYTSEADFLANLGDCDVLCGTEDFEELGIPPGSLVCYPYPPGLQPPTITGPMHLYSSYMDPSCDILAIAAGLTNPTAVAGPNYFAADLFVDFDQDPNRVPCAVAFDHMCPIEPGSYPIVVYDENNVELGRENVYSGGILGFLGIIATPDQGPIFRIQHQGYSVLTDNWEMYIPEPSALLLLVFGGLLLLCRR